MPAKITLIEHQPFVVFSEHINAQAKDLNEIEMSTMTRNSPETLPDNNVISESSCISGRYERNLLLHNQGYNRPSTSSDSNDNVQSEDVEVDVHVDGCNSNWSLSHASTPSASLSCLLGNIDEKCVHLDSKRTHVHSNSLHSSRELRCPLYCHNKTSIDNLSTLASSYHPETYNSLSTEVQYQYCADVEVAGGTDVANTLRTPASTASIEVLPSTTPRDSLKGSESDLSHQSEAQYYNLSEYLVLVPSSNIQNHVINVDFSVGVDNEIQRIEDDYLDSNTDISRTSSEQLAIMIEMNEEYDRNNEK